jgi:hypothetical protein
MLKKKFN